ncbi:MAG TPA: hypothetical protein VNA28_12920 [Solirubrobacteraceae bacterium]|nr:hypothetical protein [Solirubrobacteraceae bacterium]
MRLLRRPAQIITLFVFFVAPIAVAQAATASDDSREVWATVNVCDTPNLPDTIGIRASMPGSRSGAEVRWMRFVVEYHSQSDGRWYRLAGGDSGFKRVGRGRAPRQFGRSLRIERTSSEPVLLRGRVYFEWRTVGGEVLQRESARTRKGRRSNAGADPPGYSAATCTIS